MSRIEDAHLDPTPPVNVIGFGLTVRFAIAWNVVTEGTPIGNLEAVRVYLKQGAAATYTGDIVCQLFSFTGTLGVDAVPSGILAESDAILASSLATSVQALREEEFLFSGMNQIPLGPSTNYLLGVEAEGITGGDVQLGQGVGNADPKSLQRNDRKVADGLWDFLTDSRVNWFEMQATDGVVSGGGATGVTGIRTITNI